MSLNEEERKALISIRIDKAYETLLAAKGNMEMEFWSTAANIQPDCRILYNQTALPSCRFFTNADGSRLEYQMNLNILLH